MISVVSASEVGNNKGTQIVYPSDGSTNPIQGYIDNAAPGDIIIVYPGTYHGPIHINKDITLKTYSPDSHPIIDAQLKGAAITIDNGCNVEIEGFTITNGGSIDENGGGINNRGILTLKSSELSNNIAQGAGGGIYNVGNLIAYNVQITGNTARGLYAPCSGGAGIYNNGTMDLFVTTISDNRCGQGAGIYNDIGGQANLHHVTIAENSFGLYSSGAGIRNRGNVVMVDSSVKNNSASDGAGIYNDGTFSMYSSTIEGNGAGMGYGGGIYNNNALIIGNSIIQSNVAYFGGGISNSGNLNMSDSRVQYNTAANTGGGLYNNGGSYHLDRNDIISDNDPNNISS